MPKILTETIKNEPKNEPPKKRLESPKLYKNVEEISRDSYSDVELSPKANDPKILKKKMIKKRLEN